MKTARSVRRVLLLEDEDGQNSLEVKMWGRYADTEVALDQLLTSKSMEVDIFKERKSLNSTVFTRVEVRLST